MHKIIIKILVLSLLVIQFYFFGIMGKNLIIKAKI